MKTNKFNFEGRELPLYLGFGILDENSVRFENDVITADYVLEADGTTVHSVTWKPHRCKLHTQFHGEFCGTSWYPDLRKALIYDFLLRNIHDDIIFKFLSGTTSDAGNIYVQMPKTDDSTGKRICCYPAGRMLSFFLPLPVKDEDYSRFLDGISQGSPISLFRNRKGSLVMIDCHSHIETHPITLAEFIVPLAYMTFAAKTFAASGLIRPCTPLRMMVYDSSDTETSLLQQFEGDCTHPHFAICFTDTNQELLQDTAKIFLVNALALDRLNFKGLWLKD